MYFIVLKVVYWLPLGLFICSRMIGDNRGNFSAFGEFFSSIGQLANACRLDIICGLGEKLESGCWGAIVVLSRFSPALLRGVRPHSKCRRGFLCGEGERKQRFWKSRNAMNGHVSSACCGRWPLCVAQSMAAVKSRCATRYGGSQDPQHLRPTAQSTRQPFPLIQWATLKITRYLTRNRLRLHLVLRERK